MAVSRIERFLLKTMVYSALAFDPAKLDSSVSFEEDAKAVRKRFSLLDSEKQQPLLDYFPSRPLLPFRIYRKTGTSGKSIRDYKFHYEYDRPDRLTEAKRLVLAGFDLRKLNGDYYTYAQLHELRKAHESGLDITPLLSNEYSRFQLKVLVPALREGYDLSELGNPYRSAREMASMYYAGYEERFRAEQRQLSGIRQAELIDNLTKEKRLAAAKQPRKPQLAQIVAAAEQKRSDNVIPFPGREKGTTPDPHER